MPLAGGLLGAGAVSVHPPPAHGVTGGNDVTDLGRTPR